MYIKIIFPVKIMEEIREKFKSLIESGDVAMAITYIEEATKISRQRSINRSFRESSREGKMGNLENSQYLFITVNPAPECTLDTFKHLINKMLTKKWLSKYIYVLEQRGVDEDTMGKGFHMHMIIQPPEGKSKAHIIREIGNTYKKVCDVTNFHCYNTKYIDQEEYLRKLEYMLGVKESTSDNKKDLKQAMDKVWRQKENLQSYYFLNIDIGHYG